MVCRIFTLDETLPRDATNTSLHNKVLRNSEAQPFHVSMMRGLKSRFPDMILSSNPNRYGVDDGRSRIVRNRGEVRYSAHERDPHDFD